MDKHTRCGRFFRASWGPTTFRTGPPCPLLETRNVFANAVTCIEAIAVAQGCVWRFSSGGLITEKEVCCVTQPFQPNSTKADVPSLKSDWYTHTHETSTYERRKPVKQMRRRGSLKASNEACPVALGAEKQLSPKTTRGGNDLARVPCFGHCRRRLFQTREGDGWSETGTEWRRLRGGIRLANREVTEDLGGLGVMLTRGMSLRRARIPERECEQARTQAWSCKSGSCRRRLACPEW